MSDHLEGISTRRLIQTGTVVENRALCREHFRLTMRVAEFEPAQPGQFVHVCPAPAQVAPYQESEDAWAASHDAWWQDLRNPMLRRAFSIAELVRRGSEVDVDIIYRVVGTSTRWLAGLTRGKPLSVMGPLGKPFPIVGAKSNAWLVAGGVGLPPLLWLAKALNEAGKNTVAFCGAQTRDLLALAMDAANPPSSDARSARPSALEFAKFGSPVVISTDDGTVGFRGHVGAALQSFAAANPPSAEELVVYTCGPERMMHFVARFCVEQNIECYVCVERNMACGTGMCQSCIVPVVDSRDSAGWMYKLCCTEGPVFEGARVIWD